MAWSWSVKKVHDDAIIPEYKTPGSVGFDFHVVRDQRIGGREMALIRTGLVISTPPGHMLMVSPRSSTFKNHGIIMSNSVGIIDQDYCGEEDEIYLQFYNPRPGAIYVHKGERLAQGIFVKVEKAEFTEVEEVGASRGGFGSTGR